MADRLWALLITAATCWGCDARFPSFEKHTLDPAFRAEAVAVFDVDRDGHPDIVTDELWYAGPSFAPHEIRAAETYDPLGYSHGFGIFPVDADGDGYQDIVVAQFPSEDTVWYRNPGGADVRWDRFVIAPGGNAELETPIVEDLFDDGRPVLIMADTATSTLGWYAPAADPTLPWVLQTISAASFPGAGSYIHGLGAGDVDGDGRLDVLTSYGWFQQTTDRDAWIWHDAPFAPNRCAQLRVFDADGDGRADVFCSAPHDYGFDWLRQLADGTFEPHSIDTTVSQMHALQLADLDGDGMPELISGKRWWAHGPDHDPGAGDPAVLAIYRPSRSGGAVAFQRVDLDDASGVGTTFTVADADGDGRKDIVVSNKHGLSWFRAQ